MGEHTAAGSRTKSVQCIRGQRAHEHSDTEAAQQQLADDDQAGSPGGTDDEHLRHKLNVLTHSRVLVSDVEQLSRVGCTAEPRPQTPHVGQDASDWHAGANGGGRRGRSQIESGRSHQRAAGQLTCRQHNQPA
eukprot:scaffold1044_cov120-Isochrysis_galbana.AAC.19